MAIYAIGDIQGCYQPLQKLLEKISFDSTVDTLWFTGDLVNRGPESLSVLRFVKSLGTAAITVLGNHDLHLLAVAAGVQKQSASDTLDQVLRADDRDELLRWLRYQPLAYYSSDMNYLLLHAGVAPSWDISQVLGYAREVEQALQNDDYADFLAAMYGDEPDSWSDDLTGQERLRVITNYLTRVRMCYVDGRMVLAYKGKVAGAPDDLVPWYQVTTRATQTVPILFGHWAALQANSGAANVHALDSGCVWGECLTAMRLDDGVRFSVDC